MTDALCEAFLAKQSPSTSLARLDCGHLLPEERPDQVSAELQQFFRV